MFAKKFKCFALLFGLPLFLGTSASLYAQVNIFACEPEWKALADEIGGKKVKTFSATNAFQDPHYIRARPSLIAKIRSADLVLCTGASLEIGWLPLLLQRAKASVQIGEVGNILAAEHVPVLSKPKRVDRSMGDVHPEGDPHIHSNPNNILKVAQVLTKRLKIIDANNQKFYQNKYNDFSKRWQQAILRWQKQAKGLRGKAFITHHKAWAYLFDWLGMKLAATLEPKPGIPPTSSHLKKLLAQVRQNKEVLAIIRASHASKHASLWLAKKSNIAVLTLPYTVGGNDRAKDLFGLFEHTISTLRGLVDSK